MKKKVALFGVIFVVILFYIFRYHLVDAGQAKIWASQHYPIYRTVPAGSIFGADTQEQDIVASFTGKIAKWDNQAWCFQLDETANGKYFDTIQECWDIETNIFGHISDNGFPMSGSGDLASASSTGVPAPTAPTENTTSTPVSGGLALSDWIPQGPSLNWHSVASSSDGIKLVAGTEDDQIYTSTDSGVTWTPRGSYQDETPQGPLLPGVNPDAGSPAVGSVSVASSTNGTKLVAVVGGEYSSGHIYTSTDSGATWTPRDSARYWSSVASSSDGTKLVATVGGGAVGFIYTSNDSGVTWIQRGSSQIWDSVASSSDGTKLVAVNGCIYTSTDSGVTWVQRGTGRNWLSVASSADGTKLVGTTWGDQIYTSTDSGETWTPRDSVRNWSYVASSADGTKLVAVEYDRQIYTSTDSGVSWVPRGSTREWGPVASSADGTKLAAAETGNNIPGQIYTASYG